MAEAPGISRDLLARARFGDAAAFRLVVDGLARFVYNLAYRFVFNRADAEDVTQEIFLRLHRNLARYDPAFPFMPWFRTLASNVCLNWRRRQPHPLSLDAMEADPGAPTGAPPGDPSALLQKELERLPAEYRLVLLHLYYEGLSVAEISAAMNVPSGTVKTWLFRAREQLKGRLSPHEEKLLDES